MKVERSHSSAAVLDLEDAPRAPDPVTDGSLIDSLLDEQGDLSAVERFAQFHEDTAEPLQGRYYSALMPARPPGPGQQLAFEVDLDRCSGCKACVAACHALNGLDEGETWRDVGLIVGGPSRLPVLQHVTSSCHHCLEPACLRACPVDAYEKDPTRGSGLGNQSELGCRLPGRSPVFRKIDLILLLEPDYYSVSAKLVMGLARLWWPDCATFRIVGLILRAPLPMVVGNTA